MMLLTLAPIKDNQYSTPAGHTDAEGSSVQEIQNSTELNMCNPAEHSDEDFTSDSKDLKSNGFVSETEQPFFCHVAHADTLTGTEASNHHYGNVLEQPGEGFQISGWDSSVSTDLCCLKSSSVETLGSFSGGDERVSEGVSTPKDDYVSHISAEQCPETDKSESSCYISSLESANDSEPSAAEDERFETMPLETENNWIEVEKDVKEEKINTKPLETESNGSETEKAGLVLVGLADSKGYSSGFYRQTFVISAEVLNCSVVSTGGTEGSTKAAEVIAIDSWEIAEESKERLDLCHADHTIENNKSSFLLGLVGGCKGHSTEPCIKTRELGNAEVLNPTEVVPDDTSKSSKEELEQVVVCSQETQNVVEQVAASFEKTQNAVEQVADSSGETESQNAVEQVSVGYHKTQNVVEQVAMSSKEIKIAVEQVAVSSEETQNAVEQVAMDSEETQNAVEQVTTDSEETENAVEQVAVSTEETQNTVEQVAGNSEETENAEEEVAVSSEETQNAVEQAALSSEETENAVEQVSVISNETQDAVEQVAVNSEETQNAVEQAALSSEETENAVEQVSVISNETQDAVEQVAVTSEEFQIPGEIQQKGTVLTPAHVKATNSSALKDEAGPKIAEFFRNAREFKLENEIEEQDCTPKTITLTPKSKHDIESPRSLRALLSSEDRFPPTNKDEKPYVHRKDVKGMEYSRKVAPASESNGCGNHLEPHTYPDKWYESTDNDEFTSGTFSGPITFSGGLTYSGIISYSGPVPHSGSISHRSDSSTSTRSFAFPILASDWNSSPVKMAPPDSRFFRQRRKWHCCFCCKCSSTLFD